VDAVLDIGNSKIKIALFEKSELKDLFTLERGADVEDKLSELNYKNIIISSVQKNNSSLLKLTAKGLVLKFDGSVNLPITIDYKTPETLGADRVAAAVGAWKRFPGKDCLIIDMGTCITYDHIDSNGCFRGGAISPGIQIRLRSLYEHTSGLPLIEPAEESINLTGKSTRESILSGVLFGTKQEIEGFIRSYRDKIANLQIIFTGGGYSQLKNIFKHENNWVPHLVLEGLNGILEYNAEKK